MDQPVAAAAPSDQESGSNSDSPLTFPDSPSGQPSEDSEAKMPLTLQNLTANQWVHLTRHFGYIDQATMMKQYDHGVLFESRHHGAESYGVFDVAKGYLPAIRFNIAISPGAMPGSCPVITQTLFDRISAFPSIHVVEDAAPPNIGPAAIDPRASSHQLQAPYAHLHITTKVRLDFALPIRFLDPHKKILPGRSAAMTISCRFTCFVTPDCLNNDTNQSAIPVVDMWLPANERYLVKVDNAPGWLINPSFANLAGLVETPGESFLKLAGINDTGGNTTDLA